MQSNSADAVRADLDASQLSASELYHPPKGKPWARWLLARLGWQVRFAGLPQTAGRSCGVIIAYPHTSNWDGFIGVLTIWALGIKLRLWGKASLFRIPGLAAILRSAGAVPVERTGARASRGVVADTVAAMRAEPVFWLGLSPEGTRKHIPGWRTGFYHVACQAEVPVGIAYLDWKNKRIGVTQFLWMTGDIARDFERIAAAYVGVTGCRPENAAPIAPLAASFDRVNAVVKA